MESPQTILEQIFGYTSFRYPQLESINSIHEGKDTLVIMPTGGGKSICYQVLSLQLDGLTIVVSPLISLMQDQISQLHALGIPALTLNSSLSLEQYRENGDRILNGEIKLLYLAPETLVKPNILTLIKKVGLSLVAVDEAHCISAWGHNFRPEYRFIAKFREDFPTIPCLALTASATAEVQKDIQNSLGFKKENVFNSSFLRKNIHIRIFQKEKSNEQVLKLIRSHKGEPGLVYCYSRKMVDNLVSYLTNKHINARGYHAGLTTDDRAECQREFINDNVQVVVATVAFGMGIDKSNVRFVIHKDLPKSLEGYYQEIGRSGRDGEQANVYLLYSAGDVQKIMYFVQSNDSQELRTREKKKLDDIMLYAESPICRWKYLLNYFGESLEKDCDSCDNCLDPIPKNKDLTIMAQKVISAIYRTKLKFSSTYIIDILRGESSSKSDRYNHHDLPTWGVGKDLSRKEWNFYIRQMILDQLLEVDYQMHWLLKPTPKGLAVLQGKENYLGIQGNFRRQTEMSQEVEIVNKLLYKALKDLRKELAIKKGIPPYVVFSDKSLKEMAAIAPSTLPEFLEISGVGEYKSQEYGDQFIKLIREYTSQEIAAPHPDKFPEIEKPPSHRVITRKDMLDLLYTCNNFNSLCESVSQREEVVLSWIEENLPNQSGFNFERLLELSDLAEIEQERLGEWFHSQIDNSLEASYQEFFKLKQSQIRLFYLYFKITQT